MTVCAVCGARFKAKRRHRATCSDRCRQALHRSRREAADATAPLPTPPEGGRVTVSTANAAPETVTRPLAPRPGNGRAVAARCARCRLAIVAAELDPTTGKPWMLDGEPVHEECGDYLAGTSGEWRLDPANHAELG